MAEHIPAVSVVMAAYKTKQEYLREAIESILQQTFGDFEFIVVDDGLSEENRSYLESLRDKRLKVVVNDRNVGQSVSVNKGIRMARGKYIARMDSDDIALPSRLNSQVEYMELHPECIACGGFAETTDKHRILPVSYPNLASRRAGFFFACDMIHPTMMIRSVSLREFGIRYDEEQLYAQDYMIWTELLRRGEVGIVDEVVLRYRIHEGQITSRKRELQDEFAIRAQRKLFKDSGFDVEAIDFALHSRLVKYDIDVPLSAISAHLRGLVAQARNCLSSTESRSFVKELDFRALKAGVREIASRGNIPNGVTLVVLYGLRPCNWGYYIARSRPARLRQNANGKEAAR